MAGMNMSEIAKKLNSSASAIRYNLIKNDIPLRTEFPLKKPWITNRQISDMLKKGMNAYQISKKLGVSNPAIYHRIKKMNQIKRDRTNG